MGKWEELEKKYMMGTPKRVPGVYVKGKGARLWDENGKQYLDFVAGWAVDSLGHCHPAVVKAVTEQVQTLIQTSNQFYTIPQIQLAELLAENSCLNKAYFCNSGAEAAEGAVKLARRYGKLKLKGAYEVITALNSFHGRTLAMTAATGQAKFQEPYLPMPIGFINVAFNNIEAIKAATTDKTCAVMLEPIQAEGGVNLPGDNYLKEVRAWCDQKGILLILDEIQTGIGRVGKLFAYEHYGVEPDIMALAKGLGSGIPIGAIMAKDNASVFVPGDHGSTFGGNPLACAAAYATVKFILDNDIAGNAQKVGEYFMARLKKLNQKYPFITDVRGLGLLQAMEFSSNISQAILLACLEGGLLV
ncbi:MAG: aspartate aminotransferase family protein, partial [Dehalococcoidales bacterium]|nr:aspartate aminotransferase family protein [Dehalococcoidales bacterium]